MGDMRVSIASALEQAQLKRQQNQACGYDPYGAADIFFVSVRDHNSPTAKYNLTMGTNPDNLSGQIADVPIALPKAYRKFRLVSMKQGHSTASVFISLLATGLTYTPFGLFTTPFPTGKENWYTFPPTGLAIGQRQGVIILKNATDLFYVTIDDGTGSQPEFCIACYNDAIDDKSILGNIHY
jgi:hypothetical protein